MRTRFRQLIVVFALVWPINQVLISAENIHFLTYPFTETNFVISSGWYYPPQPWLDPPTPATSHYGIDYKIKEKMVVAAADGIVEYVLDDQPNTYPYIKSYGNNARLNHSNGHKTIYGHLKSDHIMVEKNQRVYQGQPMATSGNSGYSTGPHLHFEDWGPESGGILASGAYKYDPYGLYKTDGDIKSYATNAMDETKRLWSTSPPSYGSYNVDNCLVGCYADGIHIDGSSKAFIDAFNLHYSKIGWPVDKGGGHYVHKWTGLYNNKYRVWLEDFQGDLNLDHFGDDGQSAIILNTYLKPVKAYLVKEGFWGYYKTNNGSVDFGEPFTEEVTTNYADSPFNLPTDPVKAGDTITVQKFMRVYDGSYLGQPAYDNERRTLVYNNTRGGKVERFAVGTFSIGNDFCPAGEQAYVYAEGPLANDRPWPNSTRKVPTGDWHTKSGDYIFVRHVNGQRIGARSAHIGEGNHQFIDNTISAPKSLKILPP